MGGASDTLLGLLSPAFRTVETILLWWTLGATASVIATVIALRHLPWRQALQTPIDWHWIKVGVKKCFFIWLGVIGSTIAIYVDRFVVQHDLGLGHAGIASFYGSFVIAIQALLQSGVFSFSYPQLISHHRSSADHLFRNEFWRMTGQATLFAGILAIGVGITVPIHQPCSTGRNLPRMPRRSG